MTLSNGETIRPPRLLRADSFVLACFLSTLSWAQDLAPRAYIITPVHSNAVTLTYAFFSGGLLLDGDLPIEDVTARASVSSFSFSHSLRILGRSASFSASLPYGVGNFQGTVAGTETTAYRSGMLDSSCRFSINLKGGPAMDLQEFRNWQQKTVVGASFKLVVPSGQYDPTKPINFGANRWAFKPEAGLSRRWGHWVVDTYGAVWFFTTNHDCFRGISFRRGQTRNNKSRRLRLRDFSAMT